jgi:hypothetical protein
LTINCFSLGTYSKGRNVGNKETEINNETIIHKKIKIQESKRKEIQKANEQEKVLSNSFNPVIHNQAC